MRSMSSPAAKRLALIGFGEAGATFARASNWGATACAFDVDAERKHAMAETGIVAASDAASALEKAPLVLCLVTADQALDAAREYAPFLQRGAIWCDMNSVAPDTKRQAAKAIEDAGGRYVDVAILAPVEPARLKVPLLLSGPDPQDARASLLACGFVNIRVVGNEIGRAAAIKLIRSVMVKGIEALADEMMAAAQTAGVVEEVLASLDASEGSGTWAERVSYKLDRMALHGARRAAEMEEAVKTLEALGVEPVMTRGTVQRQRTAAGRTRTTRNAA